MEFYGVEFNHVTEAVGYYAEALNHGWCIIELNGVYYAVPRDEAQRLEAQHVPFAYLREHSHNGAKVYVTEPVQAWYDTQELEEEEEPEPDATGADWVGFLEDLRRACRG